MPEGTKPLQHCGLGSTPVRVVRWLDCGQSPMHVGAHSRAPPAHHTNNVMSVKTAKLIIGGDCYQNNAQQKQQCAADVTSSAAH
jgi:hypothetical protein